MSKKRFLLLALPQGYLTCLAAGDPKLKDRYKQHYVLCKINRPLNAKLVNHAQIWALKNYIL